MNFSVTWINQATSKSQQTNVKPNLTVMEESIFIVLIIFAALFGIVFVVAQARNRERMAMIEKGVNPQDFMTDRKPNSYGILKWALLLVGVGFGLFIGSILEAYTSIQEEPAYFASALFFGGAGLYAAFTIAKKAEEK
jgi:FtsH-binding integral membrane protein